jgi:hypothetical protein
MLSRFFHRSIRWPYLHLWPSGVAAEDTAQVIQARTDGTSVQPESEPSAVKLAAPDRTIEPTHGQENATSQVVESTSREISTKELHIGAHRQDGEGSSGKHKNKRVMRGKPDSHNQEHEEGQREPVALVNELLARGKKVIIAGTGVKSGKRPRYILAGYKVKSRTGETRPVAVRIGQDTLVLLDTGEHISSADVLKLQEGAAVIAVGKKRKRGVIKAKRVVVVKS